MRTPFDIYTWYYISYFSCDCVKKQVTDLHNLFSWARSSSKGLMLFIDEAEAFLGSRSRQAHTVHMRNALNALLFQTGDQSKHFMLVLATNRKMNIC